MKPDLRNRSLTPQSLRPTTRALSRTTSAATQSVDGSANGSINGSAGGGGGSRRSSVGEVTQRVGGTDTDSERPAKKTRLSSRASGSSSQTSSDPDNVIQVPAADKNLLQSQESEVIEGIELASEIARPITNLTEEREGTPQISIEFVDGEPEPVTKRKGLWRTHTPLGALDESTHPEHNETPSRTREPESLERQQSEKYEPGGILKKLPGRRRAPHADIHVEADLRRQLELKVAYRAVAKALKPILAELAKRTAQDLEIDQQLYKQYNEYDEIMTTLDKRFDERLGIIESLRREEAARIARIRDAELNIIRKTFDNVYQDKLDNRILELKHVFLSHIREAEMAGDSDATDDEDGVIPQLYRLKYPEFERIPLPGVYDSRSRALVRTEQLWDGFDIRQRFREEQRKFDKESCVPHPKGFATYDKEHRTWAKACLNMNVLHNASKAVEERAEKEAREAESRAALGLQALVVASDIAAHAAAQRTQTFKDQPKTPSSIRGGLVNGSAPPSKVENGDASATSKRTSTSSKRIRKPIASQSFILAPESQNVGLYQPVEYAPPVASIPIPTQEYRPLPPIVAKTLQPAFEYTEMPPHAPPPQSPLPIQQERHIIQYAPHLEQPPKPAPPSHNHGPSQQETPTDQSNAPDVKSSTSSTAAVIKPAKSRKRPGPRAHYATYQEPALHGQTSGQRWSPFTNTMGPPPLVPLYIKDAELGRRTSNTAEKPPSPTPPAATDLPTTLQAEARRRLKDERKTREGRKSSEGRKNNDAQRQIQPIPEPPRTSRDEKPILAPAPQQFAPPHLHSYPSYPIWHYPTQVGEYSHRPGEAPIWHVGPPPLPPPPIPAAAQYDSRRSSSSTQGPPLRPHPPPGSYMLSSIPPPISIAHPPPHQFYGPSGFPPSTSSTPIQPPIFSGPSSAPPSLHQPRQGPPPIAMRYPGQTGLQPILPATLDPNRNRSSSYAQANSPPVPSSGGGAMGVFSMFSPPPRPSPQPNMQTQSYPFYSVPPPPPAQGPPSSSAPMYHHHHHHNTFAPPLATPSLQHLHNHHHHHRHPSHSSDSQYPPHPAQQSNRTSVSSLLSQPVSQTTGDTSHGSKKAGSHDPPRQHKLQREASIPPGSQIQHHQAQSQPILPSHTRSQSQSQPQPQPDPQIQSQPQSRSQSQSQSHSQPQTPAQPQAQALGGYPPHPKRQEQHSGYPPHPMHQQQR